MSVSIHLERRLNARLAMRIAVPVAAVAAGLVAGGVILALGGHDPIDAYNSMWEGSLGSSDGLQATLIKACPLVLTGLAVATALRVGLWNIGDDRRDPARAHRLERDHRHPLPQLHRDPAHGPPDLRSVGRPEGIWLRLLACAARRRHAA